jgi:hypothetical protein
MYSLEEECDVITNPLDWSVLAWSVLTTLTMLLVPGITKASKNQLIKWVYF